MSTLVQNILIVDDFAADRELYRRYLLADSRSTYHPIEAESVAEGLELCANQQIDAVLLDYMLPDGDGLEFLAALAQRHRDNPPPVVMMTGQGSENIAVRAIKLGAQDYLVKRDLTSELLQLTVRKAIDNHRLRLQLQHVEARFRMTLDNLRECVSIFSAIRDDAGQIIDFRFDYLNPAALENHRMTGKDIGKSLCNVFPAFRTSGLFEEYIQLIETGEPLIKEDLVYEDVFGGERFTRVYSLHATKLDDGFVSCCRDETAQRQADRDLQAADRKIMEIWESMTDAYVTVDRDWRMIYANRAATQIVCQITNLAPSEFLGRSHWELFPSLVGGAIEREYRRALTDGVAVHLENWFEPTGSWFEVHLYPAIEGLGIYFRDITERKRMEAEQTRSQQDRDRFFNLSIDMLAIANFDGYFTRLNPAWEKVLGFTLAELMAQPYLDFIHPDDIENTLAAARGLSVGEVVISFENRYRCKDGSYRWLLWSAMPYTDGGLLYAIGHDITTRKQLELDRFAAEQERDRFFNLSLDLLAVGSFDGYFVRLNPAFEQILGFTNAELMAAPFSNFLHPDDRERTLSGAQSLVDGQAVVSFENRYRCKDDTYRWVSWNAIPHPPSQAWYAIGHDITERKQMEAALQASESKFSAIFEQSFELMGIVSLDGVLLEVNQTALDSIVVRKEDIVGQYFWDTPWWHTEQLQQQLKEAIDRAGNGEFIRYEVQFPHPNGVMLTTDFSLKPVFDDRGRVWTIVAEARDITDRKRAERDLQESQERLQAGIAVAGVGLARFDYATNLVALSPEAAALFGFAPDTSFVTREQIHDTFHPDERAELEEIIAQVINPESTGWFARDRQVVWPNGEVRCLSVRQQVFFDRSGAVARPSYAVLAAIDITERHRDRSALEERNQELDSFVHVVSHDLKAPLRAIANLSRWIEEDLAGSIPAANQEQMTMLRTRVNRMEATIDGLLDYARSGRTEDSIEPVDVSELIAETIDTLASPPTFTIAIAQNLPTLYTKRLLLTQVFTNLIGNAIKHHDRVDGTIHLGIAERPDCYEFAIADDGPGIALEFQERVFNIFQAVNPQNRTDSTGIGLAIVKKIVEAEGGTIRLESEPGRGTIFYFTWPKRSPRG
jgi:PAS domain S-box-containing protein